MSISCDLLYKYYYFILNFNYNKETQKGFRELLQCGRLRKLKTVRKTETTKNLLWPPLLDKESD